MRSTQTYLPKTLSGCSAVVEEQALRDSEAALEADFWNAKAQYRRIQALLLLKRPHEARLAAQEAIKGTDSLADDFTKLLHEAEAAKEQTQTAKACQDARTAAVACQDEEGNHLLCPKARLELSVSEGRRYTAAEDIEAFTDLVIEEPYAAVITKSHRQTVCSYLLALVPISVDCLLTTSNLY